MKCRGSYGEREGSGKGPGSSGLRWATWVVGVAQATSASAGRTTTADQGRQRQAAHATTSGYGGFAVGKRAGRALAGGGPGGLEGASIPPSTAGPVAIASSRGPGPLQANGPDASGGPAADRLDGSTCAPAYSNGATSASTLSGPAGVAGLAGTGVVDAAPAGADAADDGGPGHLLLKWEMPSAPPSHLGVGVGLCHARRVASRWRMQVRVLVACKVGAAHSWRYSPVSLWLLQLLQCGCCHCCCCCCSAIAAGLVASS